MTESTGSIGPRMTRGAAWMVSFRGVDRLLGFLSTLILARLLFPADFGLVALALSFAGILSSFSEFGFGLALIQKQEVERRHYDTAWTFGVLRGTAIAVILLLIARPAAGWFNDARLSELIMVIAVISLVSSFTNIGIVEFQKQLVYQKEFLFRISGRLAGVITTLLLAYFWRNYWALVGGLFMASLVRLGLSYTLHSYRPRFSLAGWHDLFHFSKWILMNGIISFAGKRAFLLVIGAILTPTGVGIFSLSNEVANIVSQAFVAPIKRVLFPGYSKVANDPERLKKIFLASYSVIVLVATPAAVGIGMTADLAVPLLLGERWLDTVPIVEVLVIAAFIQALQHAGPLLFALNRPDIVTYLGLFIHALLLPALILGVWTMGLLGAAWAMAGMRFVEVLIHYVITNRMLHVSFGEFCHHIWRSLVACALLALSVYIAREMIVLPTDPGPSQRALKLMILIATGGLTYVTSTLLLWVLSRRPAESAEAIVLSGLRKVLLKKTAQPT